MSSVKIKINNSEYSVEAKRKILSFCREKDLPVASLCQHPDFLKSEAVCRLCLVKVRYSNEENFRLLPSCVLEAEKDMEIITQDSEIMRIRKTILELLFWEHAGQCAHCYRNMNCDLQKLALEYDIDGFRFLPKESEIDDQEERERLRDRLSRKIFDTANPSIARDNSKCVECRRCIQACDKIQSVKALNTQKRGCQMGVGTEYYTPLECTFCGQCAVHCPTAAIIEKNDSVAVLKAIKNPRKTVIAQVAPSVRATIGEEFGFLPGTLTTGKMVASLRKCGFDFVFDVITGADFTIVEESTELINRINENSPKHPLPLFTSCCPAWVLFCEQNYPEILPYLSSTRSPQQMMGSLVKTYYAQKIKVDPTNIVLVSIMPCTAKKYEITRPEFSLNNQEKNVDYVLTVREIAHLIKNLNIPFAEIKDEDFDPALGVSTGAGLIFSASGGVAEAALRTASFYLSGKNLPTLELKEIRGIKGVKEASLKLGGKNLKIAVVQTLRNARKIVEQVLKDDSPYHFIEVMACPGGCIGGGGQPIPVNDTVRKARIKSIYLADKNFPIRESHNNPVVKEVYRDFLYAPGSRKAEKLLHTKHYPYSFPLRKKHLTDLKN